MMAVGLAPMGAQALSANSNTRLDTDGSLMNNAGSAGISADAQVETTIGIDNSNYLEILRQRRAEWQNEHRTGTSSEEGTTSRNKNRDRLNQNERESFLTTLRERREGVADARAELRAENRANAALSVSSQQRIENFANGLFSQMERALIRLENIADRIENKIEEFTAQGNDLSAEAEMLAEARLSLEAAETEVAEADLALEAMLSSENPKEGLSVLRTALSEAREAIRTTRQELMQVVQSIKAAVEADAEVEAEAQAEVEN